MFRSERLNDELGLVLLVGQSTPQVLFIATRSNPGSFVGRGCVKNDIHEELARFRLEIQHRELADRFRRRLLGAIHDKRGHRGPAQLRCALDEPLLIRCHPRLETLLLLGRTLKGFLVNMSAADPLIFTVTAAFVVALALVAAAIPARRAMRVDPIVALRYE